MGSVTPFLAKRLDDEGGQLVVVLGFSDEHPARAICAGSRMALVHLTDLEVVRAAVDWPRPHYDSEEVDRIFGPSDRAAPPRSALRIG